MFHRCLYSKKRRKKWLRFHWIHSKGAQKFLPSDTHLDLMNGGSVNQLLYRKMVWFVGPFWSSIWSSLFYVFGVLNRYLFRFQIESGSKKDDLDCDLLSPKVDDVTGEENDSGCSSPTREVLDLGPSENENSCLSFKFQFQSPEEIRRSVEESDSLVSEVKTSTMKTEIHKYNFISERDFVGFIEEPQIMSINIKEAYIDSEGDSSGTKETDDCKFSDGFLMNREFRQLNSKTETLHEKIKDSSAANIFRREEPEKSEPAIPTIVDSEIHEVSVSEKEFCHYDSDPESISLSDGLSVMNPMVDSDRNEFSSEIDYSRFKHEMEVFEYMRSSEAMHLRNSCYSDTESVDFSELESVDLSDQFSPINSRIDAYKLYLSDAESFDFGDDSSPVTNQINGSVLSSEFLSEADFVETESELNGLNVEKPESMDELQRLEETHLPNSQIPTKETTVNNPTDESNQSDGFLSENDFGESKQETEEWDGKEMEPVDESHESGDTHLKNSSNSDSDDSNGLESLWEDQDVMEQLRMELRKVRATGLPTILEESESPKMMDDLKPWKIDGKFLEEDPMDELQKFYKIYRERMRKFDILNFQKTYAIGFLRDKDPFQSIACRKNSTPTVASVLSESLRLRRHRKSNTDRMENFIKELLSDLETVYVGQACLSWEFLHWQYWKSRDIPLESDPHGCRQYNQVAGEFQRFQVLVQRFLENEPFQGPRVQHYVKTRFVLRNLLQVPAIKEDCLKERMDKERSRGNDAITGEMLMTTMEESMRIFWEFIKADKHEANVIFKGSFRTQTELQDPVDSQLWANIQSGLQKTEKRLKDLARTGICLVKRCQKNREDGSNLALFFSQIDVKLVSRVLKMSRITTDQLLWCHKKLSNITFHDRKLYREPSFLPFPC